MTEKEITELREALARIYGDRVTILPDEVFSKLGQIISKLGPEAIRDCAGKSPAFKLGYFMAASRHMETGKCQTS